MPEKLSTERPIATFVDVGEIKNSLSEILKTLQRIEKLLAAQQSKK